MRRYIVLLISILTTNMVIHAEGLQFHELRWEFGTIAEEGGAIEHEFRFTNGAKSPVVIQRVQSTCGCTTPEYSKAPIMPGAKGSIKIKFDPMWRAGRNIRDIYVYTSADKEPIVLRISGDVTERHIPIEERFPYRLENSDNAVRIETTNYAFRAIERGEMMQAIVTLKNPSKKGVEIELRNRNNKSLMQHFYSREIAAGAEATVEVSYLIEEDSQLRGRLNDTLDIFIDGRRAQHTLNISALIVEN